MRRARQNRSSSRQGSFRSSRSNISPLTHTMDKSNPSAEGKDLIDYFIDDSQLDNVMQLTGQDLSESYSSEVIVNLSTRIHAIHRMKIGIIRMYWGCDWMSSNFICGRNLLWCKDESNSRNHQSDLTCSSDLLSRQSKCTVL